MEGNGSVEAADDEQEGETRPDLVVPNYYYCSPYGGLGDNWRRVIPLFPSEKLGAKCCIAGANE